MQTPNDKKRILANIEALLLWVLMCLGVTLSVAIVVKVFFSNKQPATTTTINNYFVNNQEVTNGFSKFPNGY